MNPEYSNRLQLMAPVPAAVVLVFLLAACAGGRAGGAPGTPVSMFGRTRAVAGCVVAVGIGALTIASAVQGLAMANHAIIAPESAADFRTLREQIPDPEHTLVVAHHGLEWWAAYFLHTPVREGHMPGDAFQRYKRVLVLQEKRPMGPMGGPPGGGPAWRGDGFGPAGDGGRRGPPMRGPMGGPGGGGPSGGPGGGPGGGPMGAVRMPEGSRLVAETEYYRLYEVRPPVSEADDTP